MKATHCKYILDFKLPSGTSRGTLTEKESHFIIIRAGNRLGIGECGLLKGLSVDPLENYDQSLDYVSENISLGLEALLEELRDFPSIQFGLEQAFLSAGSSDPFKLFPSAFTDANKSIPINGLIWMGEEDYLNEQLHAKVEQGFRCIKVKVGALDFDKEVRFLEALRKRYPVSRVELRLDANGAFDLGSALEKLNLLSSFQIHSIEQPIAAGNPWAMAELCNTSPIPIALDEELIGIQSVADKQTLLQTIKPEYIILKPSLVGGFRASEEWIDLASAHNIGWWITSALESNIGLNAIAQWTFSLGTKMYQGLGTGSLYTNNFESPLEIRNGGLYYNSTRHWPSNLINDLCL